MDPDHPLAVLVQKAKRERSAAAAVVPPPDGALDPAASLTPAQYAADGECCSESLLLVTLENCGPVSSFCSSQPLRWSECFQQSDRELCT